MTLDWRAGCRQVAGGVADEPPHGDNVGLTWQAVEVALVKHILSYCWRRSIHWSERVVRVGYKGSECSPNPSIAEMKTDQPDLIAVIMISSDGKSP